MAGTTSSRLYQEADAHSGVGPNDRFLTSPPARVDPEQTIPHLPQSGHSTLQIGMDPLVAEAIVDVTNTYSRQFQVTDEANGVVPGFAEFYSWMYRQLMQSESRLQATSRRNR